MMRLVSGSSQQEKKVVVNEVVGLVGFLKAVALVPVGVLLVCLCAVAAIVVLAQLPVAFIFVAAPFLTTFQDLPVHLGDSLFAWAATGLATGFLIGILRILWMRSKYASSAVGEFVVSRYRGETIVMGLAAVVVGIGVGFVVGAMGVPGFGSELGGYSQSLIQTEGFAFHIVWDGFGGEEPPGAIALLRLAIVFLLVVMSLGLIWEGLCSTIIWLFLKGAVSGAIQGGATVVGIKMIEWLTPPYPLRVYAERLRSEERFGEWDREKALDWFQDIGHGGIATPGDLLLAYRKSEVEVPWGACQEIIRMIEIDFSGTPMPRIRKSFVRSGMVEGAIAGAIMAMIGMICTGPLLVGY